MMRGVIAAALLVNGRNAEALPAPVMAQGGPGGGPAGPGGGPGAGASFEDLGDIFSDLFGARRGGQQTSPRARCALSAGS